MLGGKYYILGKHACEECKNQNTIELYNEYQDLCNVSEFNKCNTYKDVGSMSSWNINTIGEGYRKVYEACRTNPIEHWTDSMISLKQRLDERYHDEIKKQVSNMLIARECYGMKQRKEQEKKSK